MRVTKVIRDYVEREIGAKFQPMLDNVGKEYQEEFDNLTQRLKELEEETEVRAQEIARSLGFSMGRYRSGCVSINFYTFENHEKSDRVRDERLAIERKRDEAIENILLNLELGETTKAELKGAIEAVEV